jgi:hypothetical protein
MDKEGEKRNRYSWLPEFMPGVVKLMAEKRRLFGAAWVNHCWKEGLAGKPGYFYAREGALAVGTPMCEQDVTLQLTTTQAYLSILTKPEGWKPEVTDGAH